MSDMLSHVGSCDEAFCETQRQAEAYRTPGRKIVGRFHFGKVAATIVLAVDVITWRAFYRKNVRCPICFSLSQRYRTGSGSDRTQRSECLLWSHGTRSISNKVLSRIS